MISYNVDSGVWGRKRHSFYVSYTSQLIDMGPYMDFLYWLEPDMSIKVLTYLDDPSDLGRICSVSRTWRRIGKLKLFDMC